MTCQLFRSLASELLTECLYDSSDSVWIRVDDLVLNHQVFLDTILDSSSVSSSKQLFATRVMWLADAFNFSQWENSIVSKLAQWLCDPSTEEAWPCEETRSVSSKPCDLVILPWLNRTRSLRQPLKPFVFVCIHVQAFVTPPIQSSVKQSWLHLNGYILQLFTTSVVTSQLRDGCAQSLTFVRTTVTFCRKNTSVDASSFFSAYFVQSFQQKNIHLKRCQSLTSA